MKLVRFHHLKNEAIDRRFPRTGVLLSENTIADLRVGYARYLTQELRDGQGREIAALRIAGDIVSMVELGKPASEAMEISFRYLTELLEKNPEAKGPAGEPLFMRLADCKLHAPIRPSKVVVVESGVDTAARPRLRIKANNTINSPYRDIVLPEGVHRIACETKLAIIMGKGGSNIAEEQGLEKVFAYMAANDICSADGGDAVDMYNTFLPIGPIVVTRDEIARPTEVGIRVSVNGQTKREGSLTSPLSIARTVFEVSKVMKLEVGDVILTAVQPRERDDRILLQLGDQIECFVEGIGELRHKVGNDPKK
ncbi:MAG: fumarylacetoacetate hydrolase family protein [Rhizobiaceae bacterium]|nr:fumarylacetoacetate hydrolase family protein [Rhizobiaceae bacterium]